MSMKHLFAAAAVAPLCFAASVAFAQTTVSNTASDPLFTSKTGDLDVSANGALNTKVSGPAVTVDSNNSITLEGQILVRDQANATGILIVGDPAGRTSNFTMTGGVLRADDSFVDKDTDGDGDLDGPFVPDPALRYGLRVTGPGVYTGSIDQTGGIIAVDGNGGSAAVSIETPMVGSITLESQLGTLGTNSFGLVTSASVDGNITVGGTISSIGQNATAVSIGGDVSGKVLFNGAFTNTGYRYPTRPTVQKTVDRLDADDLLQGGVGIQISNSVAKGVWFYEVVTDSDPNNTDEDNDGIDDTLETISFSLTQSGSAPAIVIGGKGNIVLGNNGTADNNNYGLILGGTTDALGIYDYQEAHAVVIGGQGGTVETTGGIRVEGTILASSVYANATALELGAGAIGHRLYNNLGTISAGALGQATDIAGASGQATDNGNGGPILYAIKIDGASGGQVAASLPTIINTGTIEAGVNGTFGRLTAIGDLSGSLTSVTNYGTISAVITTGSTDIKPGANSYAYALDLRANTSGVSVVQKQNPDTTITTVPSIVGDILFGSGPNLLEIDAGTVQGAVAFGSGASTLTIGAGAVVTGAVTVADGGSVTATVNGTLAFTNADTVRLTSLTAGPASSVLFTVDPAAGTTAATDVEVAGAATFAAGSSVDIGFKSKLQSPAGNPFGITNLTLVNAAGGLVNNGIVTSLDGKIPFMYEGTLSENANQILLSVQRRTAAQMGLEGGQAAAYDAFYNNFDKDPGITNIVLSKTTQASFNGIYNQFLPDYSGGAFNSMASGIRAIQRTQAEQTVDMDNSEPHSWLQEVGFGVSQSTTSSEIGYQTEGFGLAAGYEQPAGKKSTVGYSLAILTSDVQDDNRAFGSKLSASSIAGSFYWRRASSGLLLDASTTAAGAWFDSIRRVVDQDTTGDQNLIRAADASYYGAMFGGRMGASYQVKLGNFYVQPEALIDYVYLYESGYKEAGGGPAVDLSVAGRSSSNATAEAGLIFGARFGRTFHWGPEFQIAYRTTFAGSLGDTRANFVSDPGGSFLMPSEPLDRNRLFVRVAMRGTGAYANFALEATGEFGDLYDEYTGRLVVRFIF